MLQLTPAAINYIIYQGSTFWRKIQVSLDGAPFPFKDEQGTLAWTARMQIRTPKNGDTALVDIGTANYTPAMTGITMFQESVEGVETSWLELLLSDEDTAAIPSGGGNVFFYDIKIKNLVTGQSIRLQEGIITLSPGVTQEEA